MSLKFSNLQIYINSISHCNNIFDKSFIVRLNWCIICTFFRFKLTAKYILKGYPIKTEFELFIGNLYLIWTHMKYI